MARRRSHALRTAESFDTDAELLHQARVNNHNRQQRFEDAKAIVEYCTVIILPAGVLLFGVIYIAHLLLISDWDSFRAIMQSIAYATGGYVLSALQQRGLHRD